MFARADPLRSRLFAAARALAIGLGALFGAAAIVSCGAVLAGLLGSGDTVATATLAFVIAFMGLAVGVLVREIPGAAREATRAGR
jgi:hypothetical protein